MEKKKVNLTSLNQELNSEFMIQELEQRLETDPLFSLTPTDLTSQVTPACVLVVCFACIEIFG